MNWEVIPVTGRGSPQSCETSRLPHFRRWRCRPYAPAGLSLPPPPPGRPQGHSAAGWIGSIEKSNDLIGNRTRDIPACSIVPQPTVHSLTPLRIHQVRFTHDPIIKNTANIFWDLMLSQRWLWRLLSSGLWCRIVWYLPILLSWGWNQQESLAPIYGTIRLHTTGGGNHYGCRGDNVACLYKEIVNMLHEI
jgi:hypothetical protein